MIWFIDIGVSYDMKPNAYTNKNIQMLEMNYFYK